MDKDIQTRLDLTRIELNMKKSTFAEKLGITRLTYYKMEQGLRKLTLNEAIIVANEFNKSLNWLILGKGDQDIHMNSSSKENLLLMEKVNNICKNPDFSTNLLIDTGIMHILNKLDQLKLSYGNKPYYFMYRIISELNYVLASKNPRDYLIDTANKLKNPKFSEVKEQVIYGFATLCSIHTKHTV